MHLSFLCVGSELKEVWAGGAGPGQEHILEGRCRKASVVLTPSHQTPPNPNKIIAFCHGGANSSVTGLKSLSTLSLSDKSPTPHTWTGNLLWMISETQSGESESSVRNISLP